jgi:hypothetical protein
VSGTSANERAMDKDAVTAFSIISFLIAMGVLAAIIL